MDCGTLLVLASPFPVFVLAEQVLIVSQGDVEFGGGGPGLRELRSAVRRLLHRHAALPRCE